MLFFSGRKIRALEAREILDSRGNPTVACRVTLASGASAEARVPSGASTGSHEAHEFRDGGKRYGGKGVLKAVRNVNETIAPALRGVDSLRQRDIDRILCELDGTPDKSRLGANAILAASFAVAQASARHQRIGLWYSFRHVYSFQKKPALPRIMVNVLNGGAHATTGLDIQECMIVPQQRSNAERVRVASEVFHALGSLLQKKGYSTLVGDEGGFAPSLPTSEDAFRLLEEAIESSGYRSGSQVALALDVAASELYEKRTKRYVFSREKNVARLTSAELAARYREWCDRFPIISIEDPFAEDDWKAWSMHFSDFKKIMIVGDDLFVTNVERIRRGIKEKAANAVLIKPNQIGTLTETIEAISLAQSTGMSVVISHRSGETCDTTISDLAVACGADYIKTGSMSRSERVEKYNRLLEIETELEREK